MNQTYTKSVRMHTLIKPYNSYQHNYSYAYQSVAASYYDKIQLSTRFSWLISRLVPTFRSSPTDTSIA